MLTTTRTALVLLAIDLAAPRVCGAGEIPAAGAPPGASKVVAAQLGLEERIAGRGFPSVFQAWSPAEVAPGQDRLTTMARHDLIFTGPEGLGLRWSSRPIGLATGFTGESVRAGLENRKKLLDKNAYVVLLAEIRHRDAHASYLPEDHAWWRRGPDGEPSAGWAEGRFLLLDYDREDFQEQAARQCRAVVQSGVFDGVMLDWWHEDDDRIRLLTRVRAAIGDDALILVNSNDRTVPRSAALVNGLFMECCRSRTPEDWKRISQTLTWAEASLRKPRINCLETWFHRSRGDLHLMRATTTLALTHSDGYCLFSDPNDLPTPDHRHDWYSFWEKRLGRPLTAGASRSDGSWTREFGGGTAVYNPLENRPIAVSFPGERQSLATGSRSREHVIPPGDGDILLK